MSTSTIPKIVTIMSSTPSSSSSSSSSSTCKRPFQQVADEQQYQQQQIQQLQQQSSSNNIVMKSFPWKLYLLLERCEYERKINQNQTPAHHPDAHPDAAHNAVQWMSNGKSFIIQNKEKFTNEILPHLFKNKNNNNLDIFQTNIDMWGFTTTRIGRRKTSAVGVVLDTPANDDDDEDDDDDDDDDGDYVYCYSHPLFIKGFPFACEGMKAKSY